MPKSEVSLGLIGAGRWGQTLQRAISNLPGLVLTAVVSRNSATPNRFGPSCTVVSDWRDLVTMELDGVIVATPPAHHLEASLAMIEAGLPVLIEKPLTLSVADADLLVAAARSAGAIAMVDHIQLFAPGVVALADRLSSASSLTRMVFRSGAWGPFRSDTPVLWDWAPHDVALALHLSNAAQARVITCDAVRLADRGHGRAESIYLELALASHTRSNPGLIPDWIQGSIAVSNVLGAKERSIEVHTPEGTFIYREYPSPQLLEQTLDGSVCTHPISAQRPLDRVLLSFADRARSGAPDISGLELGRDVVRVLSEADCLP